MDRLTQAKRGCKRALNHGLEKNEASSSSSATATGKTLWSPSEDEQLRQLVKDIGPQYWEMIAQHIPGRSSKSCRLR